MSTLVGAYACPRGVSVIEVRTTRAGLQVLRTFDVPASLATPAAAVAKLVDILDGAGIRRAQFAVAVRGFGVVHHVLALPRARDELLTPIAERELRRLEPGIGNAVIAWLPLPDEPPAVDVPPQRHLLVSAAPSEVVDAFHAGLEAHQLLHLTALPAAMHRLNDEFERPAEATALVAPLRDGAFLGFFLDGAMRLVVEPPMAQEDFALDPATLAEEVELGVMFVRQQFRGAQVSRITIAASQESFPDAEGPFADRLGLQPTRLAIRELSADGLAAVGAVLDARSAHPLSFAGSVGEGARGGGKSALRAASFAAIIVAALVGMFAVAQTIRARQASRSLQDARRRIEQESFGIASMRETADQRKLIRDAMAAVRFATKERNELQQTLGAVGSAVNYPVRLDSIRLDFGTDSWIVLLGGTIVAETNGRAVQGLNDFYRDLPRRLVLEDLRLEQLTYADSGAAANTGRAVIGFGLTFVVPTSRAP